jgi:HrpA-like RNA helicase
MEGNIKSLLKELKPVENGATDWSSSTSSYKTENCYEMKKDGCDGSMRNPCQLVLERDPSLDEGLKQQLETLEERNSTYRNMLRFRCKLPAFTCKNDILELVSSNQVKLIIVWVFLLFAIGRS